MSAQEQHQYFLMLQIKALQVENLRLNNELKKVNEFDRKESKLYDPNFDKPLKDIEVNYELLKP